MKKSLTFLLTFTLLLSLSGVVFAAPITLDNPLGKTDFVGLICKIIKYINGLIGALATLMLIWGGVLFVVSAGNEARLSTAKKILIYAIIGAGIALAGSGLIELIASIIGAPPGSGCPTGGWFGF